MDLTMLVSGFREFVSRHPETKKLAFAKTIGVSPSGLSMILSGARPPTAAQALAILNLVRGGSTKIVGLQENADLRYVNGNPLLPKRACYLLSEKDFLAQSLKAFLIPELMK
jgi:transcriptional regulator with XRE-family HTH domain